MTVGTKYSQVIFVIILLYIHGIARCMTSIPLRSLSFLYSTIQGLVFNDLSSGTAKVYQNAHSLTRGQTVHVCLVR